MKLIVLKRERERRERERERRERERESFSLFGYLPVHEGSLCIFVP